MSLEYQVAKIGAESNNEQALAKIIEDNFCLLFSYKTPFQSILYFDLAIMTADIKINIE